MNLTVGPSGADFIGSTHLVIQGALDRAGALGGGTVTLLPGVYTLGNGIYIPRNVNLIGAGAETILRKADGWEVPLWEDGDWGDVWACSKPLPPLAIGDGVTVSSTRGCGFYATVGAVLEIEGDSVRINRRFTADFMVSDNATLAKVYPLVALEEAGNSTISDFVIDGNAANNPRMNGCRGGGVWGLFSPNVTVARITIRNFHGDGISFQQCHDWVVEDCVVEDCLGGGFHPGSGSQRPIIRDCTARRNAGWGLFVCWRVKHGRFEHNLLQANQAGGFCIGHKDTDNLIQENRILDNAGPGIYTRNETFLMAPHRGHYALNVLRGNNGGGPQVVLDGEVHDLVFVDNEYDAQAPRFQVGDKVVNARLETPVAV